MRLSLILLFSFSHVNSFIKPKQCFLSKYKNTPQQNISATIVQQKKPEHEKGYIYCFSNLLV